MSRLDINVRRAVLADAIVLHPILQLAYYGHHENAWTSEEHLVGGERISLAELEHIITHDSEHEPMLIAETVSQSGEKITLGSIQVQTHHVEEDEAMLGLFAVVPEYQSAGVGGTLMREGLRIMKEELGKKKAVLWVINKRVELIKWYEKVGFKETGETRPFVKPESAKQEIYFKIFKMDL